jgi:UDP-N-acetylmuramoyl-tripeptide--D-alanyl-D-alanine ligase
MRELGPQGADLHARIGTLACERGIARLFTVGPLSAAAAAAYGPQAAHFADQAALIDALAAAVKPGIRVLVKGSRGSAMEQVVRALLARAPNGANGGGTRHAA